MLRVTIFFGLIAGSFAYYTLLDGHCPKLFSKEPHEADKVPGDYYLIKRNVENWNNHGKCLRLHFDPPVDGEVRCRTTSVSTKTNETSVLESKVTIDKNYIVHFRHKLPIWGDYDEYQVVLKSDYVNYTIAVGCRNFGHKHIENAYVFSRYKDFCDDDFVDRVFDSYGIDYPNWVRIDQENCDDCIA
ncbi:uncharacterized protein LOC130675420 [Microplitis mediator]|uniref:uncharacterized protein LOC130675420 n=1 Tax=Microplitis mediator TaxID=375433 RepID=UPI0025573657|nr:uncharacterized protein LOC130675420 [Microplitis mediator]